MLCSPSRWERGICSAAPASKLPGVSGGRGLGDRRRTDGIGVGFAVAFGVQRAVTASLAPRSVTMPVAMELAERLGGLQSLTAAVVILSGSAGRSSVP